MTDSLEPDAVKVARPVLRGEEGSDAPFLPDWTRLPSCNNSRYLHISGLRARLVRSHRSRHTGNRRKA